MVRLKNLLLKIFILPFEIAAVVGCMALLVMAAPTIVVVGYLVARSFRK